MLALLGRLSSTEIGSSNQPTGTCATIIQSMRPPAEKNESEESNREP